MVNMRKGDSKGGPKPTGGRRRKAAFPGSRRGVTGPLLLFCASCGLLLGSAKPPVQTNDPAPTACGTASRTCTDDGIAPRAAFAARTATTPLPAAPLSPDAVSNSDRPEPIAADGASPAAAEPAAASVAPEPVLEARPPPDAVRILISLPQQRAYVFRAGELLATSPVSTGKRGHETPIGRFQILQKKVHHRSNLYANAPMPYMQRLTWSGIALHAGALPGYPASHGCIRLPAAFARRLYRMTNFSSEVTVTSRGPASWREARELL